MRLSDFIVENSKKISLLIFVAALIFVSATAGITGLTTATDSAAAAANIDTIRQEREACAGDLAIVQSDYQTCSTSLDVKDAAIDACNAEKAAVGASLDACSAAKAQIDSELQAEKANYDKLAKNSVRPICCSFGDVQAGAVRNWAVKNNAIICSGTATVNCATGETG